MLAGSPGGPVFTIKWIVFCTLIGFGYLGEAVLLAISVITVVPLYLRLVINVILVPKYYGRYKKISPLWLIGLPLFGVSFF